MSVPRRACPECGAVFNAAKEYCAFDGAALAAEGEDPLVGTTVDRYRIDGILGDGGMARVYRATHVYLNKSVAVKVMFGDLAADPNFERRFRREGHAAGSIRHPHVVEITDYGEMGSLPFMVMELVDGPSLRDLLEEGPRRSWPWIARVIRQIADGLEAAHQGGFVHRDLKPGNVVVADPDGDVSVKILDFGLVHLHELSGRESTRLTETGFLMGTPFYMAPEQIAGEEVTPQADLYALGAMLYRMISGRPPFTGDHREVFNAHIASEPPPLPDADGLGALALKLLEKEPSDRPAGASAVRALLDEIIGSASGDVAPPAPSLRPVSSTQVATGSGLSDTGFDEGEVSGTALGSVVLDLHTDVPSSGPSGTATSFTDDSAAFDSAALEDAALGRRRPWVPLVLFALVGAALMAGYLLTRTPEPEPPHPAPDPHPQVVVLADAAVPAPSRPEAPPRPDATVKPRPSAGRPARPPARRPARRPSRPRGPSSADLDEAMNRAMDHSPSDAGAPPPPAAPPDTSADGALDQTALIARLERLVAHDASPSRRAFDGDHDRVVAALAAARQSIGAGRLEAGAAALRRCLRLKPDHPQCHKLAGLVAQFMGRKGQARQHYERYLSLVAGAPDTRWVRAYLGEL